jgi:hypothetical protein
MRKVSFDTVRVCGTAAGNKEGCISGRIIEKR